MMATILLVEDIAANLALARKLLCAAQHDVLTAETAEIGLDLARARLPDLVLMDLGLPGMTGWEALAEIRADPATADLRVVAFTAHAMVGDHRRVLAGGLRRLPQQADRLRDLLAKRGGTAAMNRPVPLILAVDDEPANLALMRKLLTHLGYDVARPRTGPPRSVPSKSWRRTSSASTS